MAAKDLLDSNATHARKQQALRLKQMRQQERATAMAQSELLRSVLQHEETKSRARLQQQLDQLRAEEAAVLEMQVVARTAALGTAQREAIAVELHDGARRAEEAAQREQFQNRQMQRHMKAVKQSRQQRAAAHAPLARFAARRATIFATERLKAQLFTQASQAVALQDQNTNAALSSAAALARASRPQQLDFRTTRLHEQLVTPVSVPTLASSAMVRPGGPLAQRSPPLSPPLPGGTMALPIVPAVPNPGALAAHTSDR
jgi:hypothetical protein